MSGGAAAGPGPEAAAEAAEVREAIGAALASMPDVERTVIVLAYREGLTQQEIAERLHVAARHGEDADAARPGAPARAAGGGREHRLGPARRATRMDMDHADALEQIELAAVEPDGLERLMAGDTPEAAAVAGHLAGCPDCAAELVRIRRTVVDRARRSSPSRTGPRPAGADARLRAGGRSRPVGRRRRGAPSRPRPPSRGRPPRRNRAASGPNRWARYGAIAAAVVLAAGARVRRRRRGARPERAGGRGGRPPAGRRGHAPPRRPAGHAPRRP